MFTGYLDGLKKEVKDYFEKESGNYSQLFEKCKKYINSVIMNGLSSTNVVVKEYCAEAVVMGINYDTDCPAAMHVAFNTVENSYSFHINPLVCINVINQDSGVYFIVAHEITHLLNKHFHRYAYLMKDEVVTFLLNIATDIEVNYIVEKEIRSTSGMLSGLDMCNSVTPASISTVLLYNGRYIDVVNNPEDLDKPIKVSDTGNIWESWHKVEMDIKSSKDNDYLMADYVFKLLDTKMKVCLGYNSSEMVEKFYHLVGIRFINEVYKVANGCSSTIFNIPIKYKSDAQEFCTWITRYVQNTVTCYLISDVSDIPGGGKNGISEIFRGNGKGAYSITDKDVSGDIDDFINTLLESSNEISGYSRGFGRYGTSSVDFKKKKTFINWKSVLRNRLTYIMSEKAPSKKRVNRRQPTRLELSGVKSNKIVNICVAIDESGSIPTKDYTYFLSELLSVVREFPCTLTTIEFTSVVENVTMYGMKEVKNLLNSGKSMFTSRHSGGTSFQPIFDEIHDNSKLDVHNLVILFTDGEAERAIDFRGVTNRLWVTTGNSITCKEEERNIYKLRKGRK